MQMPPLSEEKTKWTPTPGPWEECRQGKCTCGQVWSIPGDFPVCTVQVPRTPIAVAHEHMADASDMIYQSITPEMAIANARLIAAAPGLYEALDRAVNYIAVWAATNNDSEASAFLDTATAALAKARGDA